VREGKGGKRKCEGRERRWGGEGQEGSLERRGKKRGRKG